MRLAALLRLTALGIALMGWLDPVSSIAPPPTVHVQAAIVRSSRDARPVGETTALETARALAADLADTLGQDGRVDVEEVPAGSPLPCDARTPCVIFTEGAALAVPADRRGQVLLVALDEPLTPNVDVRGISVAAAHLRGEGLARISLTGHGLQGATSRIRLSDGAAVVGEATHAWTGDGDVSLEVPWWPIEAGPRRLVARVITEGAEERTLVDNEVALPAVVSDEAWRVVVLERRPSWAATFIRRALEDDRRFELESRTDVAPGVSVATDTQSLTDGRLESVRVVVVGAPETLTAADVSRLEQFARMRGGAVVLVPDRPVSGAATALLGHNWQAHLDAQASAAGALRASEWLVASGVTPLDTVWAESTRGPAVVATPTGAGMVLVSGALDAWRHRGADGGFDRFWRGAIAALASAVGGPVSIGPASHVAGSQGIDRLRITARSTRPVAAWDASAVHACGEEPPTPLRAWPADADGAFIARLPAWRDGCRVTATIAGVGRADFIAPVADGSSLRWTPGEMDALVARTGGMVIRDRQVGGVARRWLDAASAAERRPESRYPMREWWWLIPFAASLAIEWWLRRRAGLR